MSKSDVDGVILVISCKKYIESRVMKNKYRLTGDSIANWKIIYVIADETLKTHYSLGYHKGIKSQLLIIKCRDDYIHLFKKIVLAQKIVHLFYNIKKGIIKCDDDILFVKKNLIDYISSPLTIDYSAKRYDDLYFKTPGPEHLKGISLDRSMHQYFMKNQSIYLSMKKELNEKIHTMNKLFIPFPKIPEGYGGSGGVYFLSTKASKIIVAHFKNCNYDQFYRDSEFNDTYPFIAEDVGTAFILCKNKIQFTNNKNLYSHVKWRQNKDLTSVLGFHTHIQGQAITKILPNPKDYIAMPKGMEEANNIGVTLEIFKILEDDRKAAP